MLRYCDSAVKQSRINRKLSLQANVCKIILIMTYLLIGVSPFLRWDSRLSGEVQLNSSNIYGSSVCFNLCTQTGDRHAYMQNFTKQIMKFSGYWKAFLQVFPGKYLLLNNEILFSVTIQTFYHLV